MKLIAFTICLIVLCPIAAHAQGAPGQSNYPISQQSGSGAPSGNCPGLNVYYINTSTGALSTCPTPGSSWVALGSGLPTGLTFVSPTLTVSSATNGNGVLALSGNTSGTFNLTAPAVAGTATNAATITNSLLNTTTTNGTGYFMDNSSGLAGVGMVFDSSNGVCSVFGAEEFCANGGGLSLGNNKSIATTNGALISGTTATISSGFGSTPSVVNFNTSLAFQINVGTGGAASTGTIGLATAPHGWNCTCTDITTNSSTVFACKQTGAGTATTAPIGEFTAAGVAQAWTASDILNVSCVAF